MAGSKKWASPRARWRKRAGEIEGEEAEDSKKAQIPKRKKRKEKAMKFLKGLVTKRQLEVIVWIERGKEKELSLQDAVLQSINNMRMVAHNKMTRNQVSRGQCWHGNSYHSYQLHSCERWERLEEQPIHERPKQLYANVDNQWSCPHDHTQFKNRSNSLTLLTPNQKASNINANPTVMVSVLKCELQFEVFEI